MRTSVLLAALASLAVVNGAVRKFTFVNKCPEPVWPGFQNSGGDKLTTSSGDARMGFSLESGSTKNVNVPNNWSGRVWGRTGCKLQGGVFTCGTGNCGGTDESCVDGNQLATLAEFTLVLADSLEPDNYDISLVDGFNLPMQIKPNKGCQSLTCATDINAICPPELLQTGGKGCRSSCKAGIASGKWNNGIQTIPGDRNCCTGPFSEPQLCSLDMIDYYHFFKDACPEAYAHAYDDHAALVTCGAKQQADYTITFCPDDTQYSAGKWTLRKDKWKATEICSPPTWNLVKGGGDAKPTGTCVAHSVNTAPPLAGKHLRMDDPPVEEPSSSHPAPPSSSHNASPPVNSVTEAVLPPKATSTPQEQKGPGESQALPIPSDAAKTGSPPAAVTKAPASSSCVRKKRPGMKRVLKLRTNKPRANKPRSEDAL